MKKLAPDRFGPYEVRKRLGAGGMGEVFLAWDHRLQRQVAIKRIRSDLTASDQRLRRRRRGSSHLVHLV